MGFYKECRLLLFVYHNFSTLSPNVSWIQFLVLLPPNYSQDYHQLLQFLVAFSEFKTIKQFWNYCIAQQFIISANDWGGKTNDEKNNKSEV